MVLLTANLLATILASKALFNNFVQNAAKAYFAFGTQPYIQDGAFR